MGVANSPGISHPIIRVYFCNIIKIHINIVITVCVIMTSNIHINTPSQCENVWIIYYCFRVGWVRWDRAVGVSLETGSLRFHAIDRSVCLVRVVLGSR